MPAKKSVGGDPASASTVKSVSPSTDPEIWREVTGELVFGRFPHRRNLVMLVGGVGQTSPPEAAPDETGPARPEATSRWSFAARLRSDSGRIYVGALSLAPVDGRDDELTPSVLRAVRPDAVVRMTLSWIRVQNARDPVPEWSHAWAPKHRRALRAAVAELDATPPAEKRRGGRPALGDDHWRDFARSCIDLNHQGKGAVLRTLAEKYGKSERTIANWLQRARNERWLQPGKQGQAWYAPGERLLVEEEETS
jgi:hypothetical protein